jgi:glycosyltransferase involved in cell wall biosynthesis
VVGSVSLHPPYIFCAITTIYGIISKKGKAMPPEESCRQKEICIIIPALNEEETIAKVIEEIPQGYVEERGYRLEILVVDNNSTDRTKQVAEEKGARIILEPKRGKGRAISAAFRSVSRDFVFILDADYTYPATYIPEMLQLLEEGYDVVLGSRLKGQIEKGAMTRFNLMGNHLLALLASLLYGTKVSDLCTGCWGFRGAVVKDLKLEAIGFDLEANMFAEIASKGYRLTEVPINYRRRATRAKLKSIRDGLRIGLTLLRRRFRP